MVSSAETWCGGASRRREPSSRPAGYVSQTGYQYDSISRVAGQRELAPPSKFSKEGGLRKMVFRGIGLTLSLSPGMVHFARFVGTLQFSDLRPVGWANLQDCFEPGRSPWPSLPARPLRSAD